MKIILLILLNSIFFFVEGQTYCNPTTFPSDIYYPNSTSTPTSGTGTEYLCGPNTVVYDTIEIGCRFVYINSFCTLYFKPTYSCAAASYLWLKNNSILNLVQGSGPTFVFYEPGAVINNPFSVTISSQSCTSISFPTVNCTPTGLEEEGLKMAMRINPNPAQDNINITLSNVGTNFRIEIINFVGQTVKTGNVNESGSCISVREIPNGMYTLNVINVRGRASKRLVISR